VTRLSRLPAPNLVAFVLAGFLVARILVFLLADAFALRDPQTALWAEPAHAQALRTADASAAKTALRRDPLTPRAIRMLASEALERGDRVRGEALMRLAAAFDPRDLVAQFWVFEREAQEGDFQAAVARYDVILRGPDASTAAILAVAPLMRDERFRAPLVEALGRFPAWRERFLTLHAQRGEDLGAVMALYGDLARSEARPSAREMRPYLDRLLREGRGEQAYAAWLMSLPTERLRDAGFLHNPAFGHPVTNMPFDWVFERAPGAIVDLGTEGNSRILNVDFFGSRVGFAPVWQIVALMPGAYAFSGRERGRSLRAARGANWVVACRKRAAEGGFRMAALPGRVRRAGRLPLASGSPAARCEGRLGSGGERGRVLRRSDDR